MTDTDVIQAGTVPVLYSDIRAKLAELREQNAALVFNYEDPKGNKDARSHLHRLRGYRGGLEKARKSAKAGALEYGRQVDAQAKEIAGELDEMIGIHQAPLDAIEKREQDRRENHERRIDRIRELATPSNDATAKKLRDALAEVESYRPGEHWEEYEVEAGRVRDESIESLRVQIEAAEKFEAEAAELKRLRREEEERKRVEREARIVQEAEERLQRAAEAREAAAERRHADELERVEREGLERAAAEKRAADEAARKLRAREENVRIRNAALRRIGRGLEEAFEYLSSEQTRRIAEWIAGECPNVEFRP